MEPFLVLLTVVIFLSPVAVILGMISPRLVLPKRVNRSRKMVLAIYVPAFIVTFIVIGILAPKVEKSGEPTLSAQAENPPIGNVTPPTTEPRVAVEQAASPPTGKESVTDNPPAPNVIQPANPAASPATKPTDARDKTPTLGVTRRQVMDALREDGYSFKSEGAVEGLENWMGQSKLGVVQILGPAKAPVKVYILSGIPKDDLVTALGHVGSWGKLLKLILPNWDGRGAWLMDAVKQGGATTKHDGILVKLIPTPPLGYGFSMSATD
jgi:hypothetical protein